MTTNMIFAGVGVVLQLLVAYVPKFQGWYEALSKSVKQLFNLAVIAALVGSAYALSYFGYVEYFAPGDWWAAVEAFIVAMVANAGTYQSTKYIGK